MAVWKQSAAALEMMTVVRGGMKEQGREEQVEPDRIDGDGAVDSTHWRI